MKKANVYITRFIPSEGIDLLKDTCDVEINPHDRPLTREELQVLKWPRPARLSSSALMY